MHAYRADLVQHLRKDDIERRITFIAWLETKLIENPFCFKLHSLDIRV